MWKRVKYVFSADIRRYVIKKFGQVEAGEMGFLKTFESYWNGWKSARSLRHHFMKNNARIELVEER
jgi:hypothetical protein